MGEKVNLFKIRKNAESDLGIVGLDDNYKDLDIHKAKSKSEAISNIYRVDFLLKKYNNSIGTKDLLEYFYIKEIEFGKKFIKITMEMESFSQSFILKKEEVPNIFLMGESWS